MKEAVLIYPHQLFENHPLLKKERMIFIIEDPLLFTQYCFHKQKILFHRASMQAHAAGLKEAGYDVIYIESTNLKRTGDIAEHLKQHSVTVAYVCDPTDVWLLSRLTKGLRAAQITLNVTDSPLFLTSSAELAEFKSTRKDKKVIMRDFYQWQRKRLDVLITENGKPVGGSWSYDAENRKKLPKNVTLPQTPLPNTNTFVIEAREYVKKHFYANYGGEESFFYPVTHKEAKKWLSEFLSERLSEFGPYEDAVTERSNTLFHSLLSPLLNCGLLSPQEVLKETLAYADTHTVPLPSLEGFVRQIIGWREYMRLVYEEHGTHMRNSNYFKAKAKLPKSFWTGTTGIEPIDDVIKSTLRDAYTHHIPRLMIMGNFMNLAGVEPEECYKWFMELFIDAYDWVMVPNVYAMALYADGGTITTKPYISGSNYILKMSDYKKNDWCDVWDGLFWNFVGKHYDLLKKENRLGFIGITYSKMTDVKKERYTAIATNFIKKTF